MSPTDARKAILESLVKIVGGSECPVGPLKTKPEDPIGSIGCDVVCEKGHVIRGE